MTKKAPRRSRRRSSDRSSAVQPASPFVVPQTGTKQSRTPFVILGMLLQAPGSGYTLRRRIEQTVGNFWHESFGQLYPALNALSQDGLIEGSSEARDARDTTVWSITPAGREALADWLTRPPQPQRERNELLLKLSFAELAPDAVKQHIEGAQAEAIADAARLQELRALVSARAQGHNTLPLWLATIDYGIAGQQAMAAWCAQAAAALDAVAAGNRAASKTRDRMRRRSTTAATRT